MMDSLCIDGYFFLASYGLNLCLTGYDKLVPGDRLERGPVIRNDSCGIV